ncbi:MAG: hypothetical protein EOO65_02015 [Methanosarcinales archaeon]|nr:MAG: hypothetical protein EOO65_02015 [Methanosarcinales archaeon]
MQRLVQARQRIVLEVFIFILAALCSWSMSACGALQSYTPVLSSNARVAAAQRLMQSLDEASWSTLVDAYEPELDNAATLDVTQPQAYEHATAGNNADTNLATMVATDAAPAACSLLTPHHGRSAGASSSTTASSSMNLIESIIPWLPALPILLGAAWVALGVSRKTAPPTGLAAFIPAPVRRAWNVSIIVRTCMVHFLFYYVLLAGLSS